MQFTQIFALFALATSASALIELKFDAPFDGERFAISAACRPITDDTVYDCGSSSDAFLIKKVTLNPRVPKRGQKLTVTISGTAQQEISKGTNAHVTAKLGIFTVVDKDYDFCEYVEDDKLKCPIQKGDHVITKVVEVPSNIPGGNYLIDGLVTLPNKKQVSRIQLKLRL